MIWTLCHWVDYSVFCSSGYLSTISESCTLTGLRVIIWTSCCFNSSLIFSMSQHDLEALFGFYSFHIRLVLNLFSPRFLFSPPFLLSFSFSCILSSFSSSSLISGLAFLFYLTRDQAFLLTQDWHSPFSLTLDLAFLRSLIFVIFYVLCWHCYFLSWSSSKGICHFIYHSEFLNIANALFCILLCVLLSWAQASWV